MMFSFFLRLVRWQKDDVMVGRQTVGQVMSLSLLTNKGGPQR